MVKKGVRIVNAVCSIHGEGNQHVVTLLLSEKWLAADILPDMLQLFEIDVGMARLFQGEDHDGFFIACQRKQDEHA
ncbi:MAG: hypothetical protein ACE5DY_02695 [Mariprofundaceae bacterium]